VTRAMPANICESFAEVAVMEAILEAEKNLAKERQGERTDLSTSGKVAQKSPNRTRDRVAAFVGESGRTRSRSMK
jgi:hypothetical protein